MRYGVIALGQCLARPFGFRPGRALGGQVMIEMAISFVAVVMMVYVTLKSWTWLATNVMQRQAAFQTTRIAAGQAEWGTADVPGQPVNFVPVPLQIVGAPGATSAGSGGIPYPPTPGGCNNNARQLARLYQDEGDRLMASANLLLAQVDTLMQLLDLWRQMEDIRAQILQTQADIAQAQADIAQTQADSAALQAPIAQLQTDINNANNQISQWQSEITAYLAGGGLSTDVYVTDRQGWIATEQNNVNNWQNQLSALQQQDAAYQQQLANLQQLLANLQQQLINLQNQLAQLQAQYDALKAGAGFAVDDSNMPNSMIAQRDAIYNQAIAEMDLANWNYNQARQLMAGGGIVC